MSDRSVGDAFSGERRSIVVLSGNPRPGSRTRTFAETLGREVGWLLGLSDDAVSTVDLADLAGEIFARPHPRVDQALEAVRSADVLIVATPVYKASYTGLLKSFLDLYGSGALGGVLAVPVTVAASPIHRLTAEAHLRPLLVELGASTPTSALTVEEDRLPDTPAVVSEWLATQGRLIQRLVPTPAEEVVP
jgi:FMN reductase